MWDLSSDESATIKQYSDTEMVLGMEGNTTLPPKNNLLKSDTFRNPKESAGLLIMEIWQVELGKFKNQVLGDVDKVANLTEEAILDCHYEMVLSGFTAERTR